jgi:hypothetical protein
MSSATNNELSGYTKVEGTDFYYRNVGEARYEIRKDSNTMILANTYPNYFVPKIQANPGMSLWDLRNADPNYDAGPINCADCNSKSCLAANGYVEIPGTTFYYRRLAEACYEIFKEYSSVVLGNTYPNYFVPKLQANPNMTLFDLSQSDPNYVVQKIVSRDNDTPRNDRCMIVSGFMDQNGELNKNFARYVTNIKGAAEVKWMYGPQWYPTYYPDDIGGPIDQVRGWSLLIEIGGLDSERAAAEKALKPLGWDICVQHLFTIGLGWTRTRQIYQYGLGQRQQDELRTGWDYLFPLFRGDVGANFVNAMQDNWFDVVLAVVFEIPGLVIPKK